MQVTVSRVSPVEIALHVALPRDRVSIALDQAYSRLGRDAQIRGFRKGKVPLPLLRQYFGPKVTLEVFRKLVDETLPGAIHDQRIDLVQTLDVEADHDIATVADWSYTARIEVRPEIPEIHLERIALTRKVYTLDDHDVQEVLEARRKRSAAVRTPDPMRPAVMGDVATVDVDVSLGGTVAPEFATHGRTVEIGDPSLLPEINSTLVGMVPGDNRTQDVTFSTQHRQKDLAGKAATLNVTMNELQEQVLPDLDDEFAKDFGKDSLDDLKASIRRDLERRFRDQSDDELSEDAIDALVLAHPVAAPPSLVANVLAQLRDHQKRAMDMGTPHAMLTGDLRLSAERQVRAGLLLNEIARVHGLTVTEAEINQKLDEMAETTGKAIQRLRAEYRDGRKREMLQAEVLQRKVMATVFSKATIQEETVASHTHAEGHEHADLAVSPADPHVHEAPTATEPQE